MTTFWERPARLDDPMLSLDNVYSQLFLFEGRIVVIVTVPSHYLLTCCFKTSCTRSQNVL